MSPIDTEEFSRLISAVENTTMSAECNEAEIVKAERDLVIWAMSNRHAITAANAALQEIAGRHIPDQPAAFGGDELDWVIRHYTVLRAIARQALGATHEQG